MYRLYPVLRSTHHYFFQTQLPGYQETNTHPHTQQIICILESVIFREPGTSTADGLLMKMKMIALITLNNPDV